MREEIVRAAVDRRLGDDVLPRMDESLQRRCHGRRARGESERRCAAFERRHALFEHVLRRIHEPAVDIARLLQAEEVGRMLRIAKHVRRRLINRHGARSCRRIGLLLADMKLQGFKLILSLVTHQNLLFPRSCPQYKNILDS